MTRERQDKLLWVLRRHAKLIKDKKEDLNVTDRVLLTYIRWIITLIVNQKALNEECKKLKMFDTIMGDDNDLQH